MTEALKKKIIVLYQNNMSCREIGEKLNLSHEYIRRVIPRNMIRYKRIDANMYNKVLSAYKKAGTYEAAAKMLNLPNRQTVYRILKIGEGLCASSRKAKRSQ